MSSKVRPLGRKSGFTLVELLIVVAIIGVLSTVGVPTFRRMIQKSKKTEAQVALGGIYTAEQSFQSEYGGYGNNLSRMGFQQDGAQNSLIYQVGFTANGAGACGPAVTGAMAGVLPTAADGSIGQALNVSFPSYFQSGTANNPNYIAPSLVGFTLTAGCVGGSNVAAAPYATFVAEAAGVVAPGCNKNGSSAAPCVTDQWTITQNRTLANIQDGITR